MFVWVGENNREKARTCVLASGGRETEREREREHLRAHTGLDLYVCWRQIEWARESARKRLDQCEHTRIVCVLQCVAMCCSVLRCVAVCLDVLQCVVVCCSEHTLIEFVMQCVQWEKESKRGRAKSSASKGERESRSATEGERELEKEQETERKRERER